MVMLNELRDYYERSMAQELKNLLRQVERHDEQKQKLLRQIVTTFDVRNTLAGLGVHMEEWGVSDYRWPTFHIKEEDKVKVAKVCGRLEERGKHVIDENERRISISLQPADRYQWMTFVYEMILPEGEDVPCQIVTTTTTHRSVVCKTPQRVDAPPTLTPIVQATAESMKEYIEATTEDSSEE